MAQQVKAIKEKEEAIKRTSELGKISLDIDLQNLKLNMEQYAADSSQASQASAGSWQEEQLNIYRQKEKNVF